MAKYLIIFFTLFSHPTFASQQVAVVDFFGLDNKLRTAFMYSKNCENTLQSLINTTKPTANKIISTRCVEVSLFEELNLNIFPYILYPSNMQGMVLRGASLAQCLYVVDNAKKMGYEVIFDCK